MHAAETGDREDEAAVCQQQGLQVQVSWVPLQQWAYPHNQQELLTHAQQRLCHMSLPPPSSGLYQEQETSGH